MERTGHFVVGLPCDDGSVLHICTRCACHVGHGSLKKSNLSGGCDQRMTAQKRCLWRRVLEGFYPSYRSTLRVDPEGIQDLKEGTVWSLERGGDAILPLPLSARLSQRQREVLTCGRPKQRPTLSVSRRALESSCPALRPHRG
eukprot:832846-Pyramimonas_sp.AAC.1